MVASESVSLEGTGHVFERDVAPARRCSSTCRASCTRSSAPTTRSSPCIFEFVYLARPDSVMDGISVYQARLNLGETLAKRVVSTVPPSEIDVIIPIPESSRPSAMQLAHLLGVPYREGFVKNRYVGRTFIMPGQGVRKKSVRQKLNVIASEFKGRNVLLVDDSIVRGTTSREIVQMARDAGAEGLPGQRRAAGALPQRVRHRHAHAERTGGLWPHGRRGARGHRLRRADLPGRRRHEARHGGSLATGPKLDGFDASCFDGVYVTGDINADDIARINEARIGQEDPLEENSSRLALPNPQEA
jgi:amidophosphoribosyltransferase